MLVEFNLDIVRQIQQAAFRGASVDEMKPLYIRQNLLSVDTDAPLHRVFQSKYLLSDIEDGKLTHIKACPLIWNSPLENPLLMHSYRDENGQSFTLEGVVEDFYAVCWTKSDENLDQWRAYSPGKPTVRVTTTPRILMDRIMNLQDNYYMLHHYLGTVRYYPEEEIQRWLEATPPWDHLDTLGQKLALSAMTLSDRFSDEEEVRLLYSYRPQVDTPWVANNVVLAGNMCRVPFDWDSVISEIVIGPYMTHEDEEQLRDGLYKKGIHCKFRYSEFRS